MIDSFRDGRSVAAGALRFIGFGSARVPNLCAALVCAALFLVACSDDSTLPAGPNSDQSPSISNEESLPSPVEPDVTPTPGAGEDEVELDFAVIGDFGTGNLNQLAVAARMCAWRENHPFDLVVTTGDNVYPEATPDRIGPAFLEPYQCLLQDGVQFRSSLGNHDWAAEEGRYVLDEPAFGMPGEQYVLRESGVRFVIANSNEMDRQWLRSVLPAEEGDRWTVVVFHHPVFSPGFHGSFEAFADLPDIFEEYGVDLVLNGHDHIYARIEETDGIRYVVTGGGGANTYPCLPSPASEVCESRHHFLYVRADKDDIDVLAIPPEGEPFDRFSTRGLD